MLPRRVIDLSVPEDRSGPTTGFFVSLSRADFACHTHVNHDVQLRDVEAADLPLFFEHQRDPEAVAMVGFNSRDRAAFDAHWAKILANDAGLAKTIVVNGKAAGHLVSFLRDGKPEVGYWLDRALWGRGIATQALSAFLRLEQRRPLYAGVARHNLASIRVLQKCGFTLLDSAAEEGSEETDSDVILELTASRA